MEKIRKYIISALIFFIVFIAFIQYAKADVQVSDEFKHVAKVFAQKWAAGKLKDVCKNNGKGEQVCLSLTEGLGELLLISLNEKPNEAAIDNEIRVMFGRIARASAIAAMKNTLDEFLREINIDFFENINSYPANVTDFSNNLSDCFMSVIYRSNINTESGCKPLRNNLINMKIMSEYLKNNSTNSNNSIFELLREFTKRIPLNNPKNNNVRLLLTSLTNIVVQINQKDLYNIVIETEKNNENHLNSFGYPWGEDIFSDDTIQDLVDEANKRGCDELLKKIENWKNEDRYIVMREVGKSIAKLENPSVEILKNIPTDLNDSECKNKEKSFVNLDKFNNYGKIYIADISLTMKLNKYMIPALLMGLLVDYAENQNEDILNDRLIDFSLRLLAKIIAANDEPGYMCRGNENKYKCQKIAKPDEDELELTIPPNVNEHDFVKYFLELRFSPEAARNTCLYQTVSTVLQKGGNPIYSPGGYCRKIHSDSPLGVILKQYGPGFEKFLIQLNSSDELNELKNELTRWNTSRFIQVSNDKILLRLSDSMSSEIAFDLIFTLIESIFEKDSIEKNENISKIIENLIKFYNKLRNNEQKEAKRIIMQASSSILLTHIKSQLDTQIGVLENCITNERQAITLTCGVRVLAESLVESIVPYTYLDNSDSITQKRLAQNVLLNLEKIDPLHYTPILFNVGLGYSYLRCGDNGSQHLTLLDKIGLAYRFGGRNQWEAGAFVGGFLDAIIRETSNKSRETSNTSSKNYWLAGGTFGIRQISVNYPIGFEAHSGFAFPFDLGAVSKQSAWLIGGTLILPLEFIFK